MRSCVRELASGMRQLAGTKTRYRRADAAPLTGLISGSAEYIELPGRCEPAVTRDSESICNPTIIPMFDNTQQIPMLACRTHSSPPELSVMNFF